MNVGGGTGTSTWTNGELTVGDSTGTLAITAGGIVTSTLGRIGFGNGTVNVGGGTGASSWNSGLLYVGTLGTGALTITGGGSVSTTNGYLGELSSGNGTVNVGGGTGNSTWTNSSDLFVGYEGDGNLTVTGGGSVSSANSYVGSGLDSRGTASVGGGTGPSAWANSGKLTVGQFGRGYLTITGGGTVSNTNGVIDLADNFFGTSGEVNVGGGIGTSAWNNSGSLTIGGDLTITGGGAVSNTNAIVKDGKITVGGGSGAAAWINSGSLLIEDANTSTTSVTITGGGTVSDVDAIIESADINVGGGVGASAWINSGPLTLGVSGAGADLTIASGGTVEANALEGGNLNSSIDFNGGTLRITGTDSASNHMILQAGGGTIDVPSAGTTLTITESIGGSVSASGGGLTKSGAGVLDLTYNFGSPYTGGTTISGGTLRVNNTALYGGIHGGTGSGPVTVQNGGTLAGGGATVGSQGLITGAVTVQSGGHIAPGNSAGILNLLSGVTFNSGSILDIELNSAALGSGYDQLKVTGTAALNGNLNVILGFTPLPSNTFTILSATTRTGTFANTPGNVLTLPQGTFNVIYGANSVSLQNFTPAVITDADFDNDGDVDGADLTEWRSDFGPSAGSDADGDGDSDGADFLAWQQQLGSAPGVVSATAVPEPALATVASAAAIAATLLRKARRQRRQHLNSRR